jgi:acyl-CoA dehydrogenase
MAGIGFDVTEEQQQLIDTAREFTRKEITPVAGALDEEAKFPREIIERAWQTGLVNCEIPEAYGGLGLGNLSHSLLLEELSYGCMGINTSIAGNSLGAMPLMLAGSEEQKQEYLGRLIKSPVFAAYACSEPDAGSDVAGMKSRYRKVGDDYVLTGQKRWITNGGVADFYTTFARLEGTERHKGITCFVVERSAPGVSVGKKENKMGQRASNTTDVIFEDVRLTSKNVVGAEGEGFKVAMRTFDRTRPWIAAGASGLIRRCLDECRNYALDRKTFGVPIAQHQAIQFMIAEMAIAYESTRLLYQKAAWSIDAGRSDSIISSYAKAYGADAAMRVATDAVQIFGGYGYTKEYPVEKLMRDAKLLQIYEGTSQIQRMVIARHVLGAR